MAADGSVIIDIEGNIEKFKSALEKLGGVAGSALKGVATAVGVVSGAIGGIATAAIKVGSDFESSMSQVAATMGMTVDEVENGSAEFELLKQAAKDAGATTAFSAKEAAEALNYLALAGYDAETAAEALPAVLNLAAAGGMDLAYASDLATDAMSALGIEASNENLTQFGDQMAKTASKANTSVAQLGEAILTVGGTAKGLAGGTVELNTALGILADNGVKGAEGGTALRNIILSLSAPTSKAAKQLEALGVSAVDSSGNLKPLNMIFADLDAALSGLGGAEKSQILNKIFNKVDLKSVEALLANCGDRFEDLSVAIEGSWLSTDSLSNSLSGVGLSLTDMQKRLEVLGVSASDFTYFLERSQGDAKDFAEGLWEATNAGVTYEDVVNALGGDLESLQTAFDGTTGAMQNMADTQLNNLQGDITILQSALSGLGIELYESMQQPLRAVTQEATAMVGQLSTAFAAGGFSGLVQEAGTVIANALIKIAAQLPRFIEMGVQAIQSFLQGLVQNKEFLTMAAIDIVSSLASGILSVSADVVAAGAELILALGESFVRRAPDLLQKGAEAVGNLAQGIIDGAPDFIAKAADLISDFAKSLSDSLPELVPKAVEMVGKLVEAITQNLDLIIDAGLQLIMALGQGLIAAIPSLIQTIPEIVINIADVINENAPKLLEVGVLLLAQLALGLIQAIPTLIANIPKIIEAIVKAWTAFDWLNLGKTAITAIKNGFTSAVALLKTAGKNAASAIQNAFTSLPQTLSGIVSNAGNGILSILRELGSAAGSAMRTVGQSIISGIKNIPSQMVELGKNIVNGIIQGIKSMISAAVNAIVDLAKTLVKKAKEALGIKSPSRVFANEVGKWIPPGISEGVSAEIPKLDDDMRRELQGLVDDANLSVAAEVGNVSNKLAISAGASGGAGGGATTVTNDNGIVIHLTYNGTSDPEDVRKISRQIGIETAREIRRRGGTPT